MARKPRIGIDLIYSLEQGKESLKEVAASVASDFSVGGGTNLKINGDTVQNITLSGGSYKYSSDTKTANISIPSNVSIVNGAMLGSIKGSTLYLSSATSSQKSSANFNVLPTAVTLNSYEPVTITANHLGDGRVGIFDDRFIKAEPISATEFRIIPQYAGTGNVGFWLDETAEYYGAAKNVAVTAENSAVAILMHFDNPEQPFLNAGYAQITEVTGSDTAVISADYGKFGNGFYNENTARFYFPTAFGGKDFTYDFQTRKANGGIHFTDDSSIEFYTDPTTRKLIIYILDSGAIQTGVTLLANEMQHLALCYKHDLSKWYFFYNGELKQEITQTFPRKDTRRYNFYINPTNIIDELRILDGVCAWTENFTPPTKPYN